MISPEDRRLAAALVGKIADLDACLALAAIAAGDIPPREQMLQVRERLWQMYHANKNFADSLEICGITWFFYNLARLHLAAVPLSAEGKDWLDKLRTKYLKESSDAPL